MKKLILILTLSLSSFQSFAGHGVERGLVNVDDRGLLDRVISGYIAKRLAVCSQGVAGEKFSVLKLEVKKHRVDTGILDVYYTIALGYTVNEENLGAVEIKLVDWDYHNYETLDQKIAFEISQDHTGLCR